jgi:hypothetical protein
MASLPCACVYALILFILAPEAFFPPRGTHSGTEKNPWRHSSDSAAYTLSSGQLSGLLSHPAVRRTLGHSCSIHISPQDSILCPLAVAHPSLTSCLLRPTIHGLRSILRSFTGCPQYRIFLTLLSPLDYFSIHIPVYFRSNILHRWRRYWRVFRGNSHQLEKMSVFVKST